MLAEFSVARAAADPAVVPQAGSAGGGGGLVYFRLHGAPRIYYSAYDRNFLHASPVRWLPFCDPVSKFGAFLTIPPKGRRYPMPSPCEI